MIYLFIISIIIIIIYLIYPKLEHYDARIINTTFNDCAEKCKTSYGCFAMAFDKTNNTCYLAKQTIDGKPRYSIFREEYNPKQTICNKLQPVLYKEYDYIPFDERRKNSIYVCKEDNNFPQWYLHTKGTFVNIGEGRNIDDIFDIDIYDMKDYPWPINKYSYDQLDLLLKDREKIFFIPENVTNLNRLSYLRDKINQTSRKGLNPTDTPLDFDLNKFHS